MDYSVKLVTVKPIWISIRGFTLWSGLSNELHNVSLICLFQRKSIRLSTKDYFQQ